MASNNNPFAQAANNWDLETLFADLASAKGKSLTPTEKTHLCGLLCGYSPAEIAEKLHKNVKGVEVDICRTIYIYVKELVGNSNGKVENWRNITEWLDTAGYKNQSSVKYQVSDCLSLDIVVKKCKIMVRKCDINIDKNELIIDLNIRLATPLPAEIISTEKLEEDGDNCQN